MTLLCSPSPAYTPAVLLSAPSYHFPPPGVSFLKALPKFFSVRNSPQLPAEAFPSSPSTLCSSITFQENPSYLQKCPSDTQEVSKHPFWFIFLQSAYRYFSVSVSHIPPTPHTHLFCLQSIFPHKNAWPMRARIFIYLFIFLICFACGYNISTKNSAWYLKIHE